MKVQVILSKRHDAELLLLLFSGYDLSLIFHDALVAYSEGRPIMARIDDKILPSLPDMGEAKRKRIQFTLNDAKAVGLLQKCQPLKRGALCRIIARQAFGTAALYAKDATARTELIGFHNATAETNPYGYVNLSDYSNSLSHPRDLSARLHNGTDCKKPVRKPTVKRKATVKAVKPPKAVTTAPITPVPQITETSDTSSDDAARNRNLLMRFASM